MVRVERVESTWGRVGWGRGFGACMETKMERKTERRIGVCVCVCVLFVCVEGERGVWVLCVEGA